MTDKTRVIFRKEGKYDDIIAIFPETLKENTFKCYNRCSGFSCMCEGYYKKQTKPCTDFREFGFLYNMLVYKENMNLKVVKNVRWN